MARQRERHTVLAIQHQPGGGPGRVGQWLEDDGFTLDVVEAHIGEPLPATLAHDAIIVCGGGFLPDDDDRAPWLAATRSLVAQALDAKVPILGICLGGQLLAHVAGGVVEGNVGLPEAGSTPIRLRPDAADDPLLFDLPTRLTAMEHHVDAITKLPGNAVWLAESDRCANQAFRVGTNAWGFQFHPEMTADRITGWSVERLREQGFDAEELHRQAVADEAEATRVWTMVIKRFAETIRMRAAFTSRVLLRDIDVDSFAIHGLMEGECR